MTKRKLIELEGVDDREFVRGYAKMMRVLWRPHLDKQFRSDSEREAIGFDMSAAITRVLNKYGFELFWD